jgi:iron complex transport system permease protein
VLRRRSLIYTFSIVVVVSAVFVGSSSLPILSFLNPSSFEGELLWKYRIPRVLGGLVAGGSLALCGLVLQAGFRNMLMTPFTIGVSSGSSLGAALVGFLGIGTGWATVCGGMLGSLTILGLIVIASSCFSRKESSDIILFGFTFSLFSSHLIVLIQTLDDVGGVLRLTRWMNGSIPILSLGHGVIALSILGIALFSLWHQRRTLTLMALGESFAEAKGVSFRREIWWLVGWTSIIVGVVVSLCGSLPMIGILEPFLMRKWFGVHVERAFMPTFFTGGALLVLCDALARSIVSPAELPVGIITGIIGAPVLLWIVMYERYE